MLAKLIVLILVVAIIIAAFRQQKMNQKKAQARKEQDNVYDGDEIYVHGEEVKDENVNSVTENEEEQ